MFQPKQQSKKFDMDNAVAILKKVNQADPSIKDGDREFHCHSRLVGEDRGNGMECRIQVFIPGQGYCDLDSMAVGFHLREVYTMFDEEYGRNHSKRK